MLEARLSAYLIISPCALHFYTTFHIIYVHCESRWAPPGAIFSTTKIAHEHPRSTCRPAHRPWFHVSPPSQPLLHNLIIFINLPCNLHRSWLQTAAREGDGENFSRRSHTGCPSWWISAHIPESLQERDDLLEMSLRGWNPNLLLTGNQRCVWFSQNRVLLRNTTN
jgi:hypothetical protein